jgi:leader peptidase (prepilin peptidase)/N-methyltransferase
MLASGPLVAMPLFLLWLLSRGKWMGFGDVKLSLGIGWLLGFAGGISSIVLAFEIGAAVSLLLLAFGHILKGKIINKLSLPLSIKKLTIKSEIPFAPFLVLGTILIFFLEWDLMGINMFLRMFGL